MRPMYYMESVEEINKEELERLRDRTIEELSEYLYWYKPKDKEQQSNFTKHSIMGPVGKLLTAISSGKVESPDALVGYVLNIHQNLADKGASKDATGHLEKGVELLMELKKETPKRLWMKMQRDIDYAVYKNKLKKIYELSEMKKEKEKESD